MLARGDLREDAAVAGVDVHLGCDRGAEQDTPVLEHRASGLIAGGFDCHDTSGTGVIHLTSASRMRRDG